MNTEQKIKALAHELSPNGEVPEEVLVAIRDFATELLEEVEREMNDQWGYSDHNADQIFAIEAIRRLKP